MFGGTNSVPTQKRTLWDWLPQGDQQYITTATVRPTVQATPTTVTGGGGATKTYRPAASTTSSGSASTSSGSGGSTSGGGSDTGSSLPDIGGLTADELNAMLNYIAATTGQTVAQLSQQAGALGESVRQMMDQINRQYQLDAQATEGNALQRGIFHSGILARNVGRLAEGRSQSEQATRSDAASKLAELQAQLDALAADNQLQAAQVGSDILQSNLDVGQQAALQNRLKELNLGGIPDLSLADIINQISGLNLVTK